MDEDMVVRGMAERTRETYVAAVTGLATYYRRSPDQILPRSLAPRAPVPPDSS